MEPVDYNKMAALKALIETRVVKSYRQIFEKNYLSANDMRRIIGHNYYTVKKKMEDPAELTMDDIIKLAAAIGVGYEQLRDIIWKDIKTEKPR